MMNEFEFEEGKFLNDEDLRDAIREVLQEYSEDDYEEIIEYFIGEEVDQLMKISKKAFSRLDPEDQCVELILAACHQYVEAGDGDFEAYIDFLPDILADEIGIGMDENEDDEEEGFGDWKVHDNGDGTCTITEYCGEDANVTIPTNIGSKTVSAIGDSAFYDCDGLKSVIVPDSVISIGEYAFGECHNLTKIVLPANMKSIGYHAFTSCAELKNVTIPNGITKIEEGVFWGCTSIKSITVPSSVTKIDYEAFGDCDNLEKIVIPESVISIDVDAFSFENSDFTIYAPAGSYAEKYAEEEGIQVTTEL